MAADAPNFVDVAFSNAILGPAGRHEVFVHSEALIQELENADAIVIATPMHNFIVPAVLKAWIDQVVRINQTFTSTPTGKAGMLTDRPVFVVIASGGWFRGPSPTGTPAQPDFLTSYLQTVLNTVGLRDIHTWPWKVSREAPPCWNGQSPLRDNHSTVSSPRVDPLILRG